MYIPKRGDLVWLNFSPQSGHEQSGKRPAFTVSPFEYNEKAGLALFCPITSRTKGYPFEVTIPNTLPIQGVILTDQVKSLDFTARTVEYIGSVPEETTRELLNKLKTLVSD
jgi:mRNA interferase MazF